MIICASHSWSLLVFAFALLLEPPQQGARSWWQKRWREARIITTPAGIKKPSPTGIVPLSYRPYGKHAKLSIKSRLIVMCIFKVLRRHRLMPLAGSTTRAYVFQLLERDYGWRSTERTIHLAVTAAYHCFMACDKHLTSQPSQQAGMMYRR
ncbi:hypothetical protein CGRA01v4_09236 [Colletotrichum graminicola]|nr:hypothetical protein CGRA01v4_09236 [Colletotrichum graminicola]